MSLHITCISASITVIVVLCNNNPLTRLISIVSKPIKLICDPSNLDEKIVKKNLGQKRFFIKKNFRFKKFLGKKNFSDKKNLVKQFLGQKFFW